MDRTTLSDEDLGTLVDRKSAEAVNWYNSKLSTERENVIRYYNGELPKRTSLGSSSFQSSDVYDSVESMAAQLLETFASGNKIVKFDPTSPEDIQDAKIATLYTDYVVYQQNPAYRQFGDMIRDGLMARVGVMKVYWDECIDYVEHEFKEIDEQEVQGLATREDVYELDAQETAEGSGRYKGKMTIKVDKSQVRMEVINPEEFSVEPQAKHLGPDVFCVQRCVKTIDELVKAGYDRAKLIEWNASDDAILKNSPEVLARFQQIDGGSTGDDGNRDDAMRHVLVNECYIKCAMDGDKYAKLYKVVRLGSETLDREEVEELPFLTFVPLPVAHSFYGNSFAARVIPAQNARTVLTRSILDHTAITTNPRYQVLKGGVVNPKELLDNRLGGIVNTTRPDAVTPLAQAPLNPFVFQTLEVIKHYNEETTGISALSQGLNKDAISKQNSKGMVEQLVSLSQTRQKIIARNFAQDFLIPLFIKVYNLVITKEKRQKIIEVAGQWQEVDPRRWKERRAATVSLHLGYGEIEQEARTRMELGHMIAQDPQLNRMFQEKGRFQMAKDVFELRGIGNFLDYLTPPEQLPPAQPDPMRMKELELEERKVKALEMQAQAANSKVEAHVVIEQARQQLEEMQRKFDNMMSQREEERKDADITNKIDVAQREIAVVEATPMNNGVASASPR